MLMIRLLAIDLSLSIRFLSFLLAVYIIHFLYKLYKIRSYFQKLQRDGLVGSSIDPSPSLPYYCY